MGHAQLLSQNFDMRLWELHVTGHRPGSLSHQVWSLLYIYIYIYSCEVRGQSLRPVTDAKGHATNPTQLLSSGGWGPRPDKVILNWCKMKEKIDCKPVTHIPTGPDLTRLDSTVELVDGS